MRLSVITLNDDFTDATSDAPALMSRHRPFAVLTQESKRGPLAARVPAGYGVGQVLDTPATAGVAVAYDMAHATQVSPTRHRVLAEPHGTDLLPRGVTWLRVLTDAGPLILGAAHRQPERYRHLWPEFDRALAEWVAEREHPVILGMDANTRARGPLARRLGMRQAGRGIDGVFVTAPLRVGRARRLRRRTSDHHPVAVTVVTP